MSEGEWKPMETAPRDGSDILAYSPFGHGHLVVAFDDKAKPGWPWHTADGPSYALTTFTHWMPLPAPPIDPFKLIAPPSTGSGSEP